MERSGDGAARRAPGEQATAQEGALERPISVHPSSPEAGNLARGIKAGQRGSVGSQDARRQIGLKAAQRLARQDSQAHGDQRAGRWIEEPMRRGGANQPAAAGGS